MPMKVIDGSVVRKKSFSTGLRVLVQITSKFNCSVLVYNTNRSIVAMDKERNDKLWSHVQKWGKQIERRPDWIENKYAIHSVIPYFVPRFMCDISVKELIDDANVLSLLMAQGYKVRQGRLGR